MLDVVVILSDYVGREIGEHAREAIMALAGRPTVDRAHASQWPVRSIHDTLVVRVASRRLDFLVTWRRARRAWRMLPRRTPPSTSYAPRRKYLAPSLICYDASQK